MPRSITPPAPASCSTASASCASRATIGSARPGRPPRSGSGAQRVTLRHRELELHGKDLDVSSAACRKKQVSIGQRITHFADQSDALLDARDNAEQYLLDAAAQVPGLDPQARLEQLDAMLEQRGGQFDFIADAQALTSSLHRQVADLQRAIEHYNEQAQPADQVLADTRRSCTAWRSSAMSARCINSSTTCTTACATTCCWPSRSSSPACATASIPPLSATSATRFIRHQRRSAYAGAAEQGAGAPPFWRDRERFQFDWDWLPEYKAYWEFFRELIQMPNLGDGTSLFDDTLSERSAEVRDQLLALLLDGDEQQALRELERISDYRRYRPLRHPQAPEGKSAIRLSEYGTGSGGQLETPAYIIRAAP
ncbi:hypothetical protein ULG90_20075 [Halopseudomonas pachastrellae]|nr:hypothetical protein ULG90_20075 [Halopseudomonas pachastrellae]